MKRTDKFFTWMLLGCFLMAMTIAANAQLLPTNMILDYDSSYVDSNLKPGDSGVLQIVVKNTGNQEAENVKIYIPGTGGIPIDKRWDIGRIEAMGSKTLSTTIHISDGAYVGLHTLQVRITYDGYDSEGERDNDQLSVWDMPLRIYGNANFQVDLEKEEFYNNVIDEIVLDLTTKDGARDISATLSSDCASMIGSAKSYIGNLGGGEDFGLKYSIQPNEVGICSLSLLMEYSDVSGNSMSETISLGIDVKRSDVDFKIEDVIYESMAPGTPANITVKLNNVGSATANDVSLTLDLTDPFTAIKSSEKYVGNIKSHETKEIEFQVLIDADADIKAYEIPLKIEYYDSMETKREATKTIGVQVSGKPDICVCLDKADLLAPGVKGTVTINVINKGFADVKFLNIKLIPTEEYDVNTINEVYIGNLDSDDTDSEEFEIIIKDDLVSGKIKLNVEVSYKEENSNIDHVDSREVDLSILSKQEYAQKMPQSNIFTMLLSVIGSIIGIIIVIIVLWFTYKVLMLTIGYLDRKIFKKKV